MKVVEKIIFVVDQNNMINHSNHIVVDKQLEEGMMIMKNWMMNVENH
jgi:hypothetical protein